MRVNHALRNVKSALKQQQETLNILMEAPDPQYEQIIFESQFVTLPVTTTWELLALDKIVKESEDFRQRLILSLGNCVRGLDTKDATKRIMAQLITNELAANCDWIGEIKKLNFSTMAIKDIVFSAVRQYSRTPNTTEKIAEQFMKLWLKYATARYSYSSDKNDHAIDGILADPETEPSQIRFECIKKEIPVSVPPKLISTLRSPDTSSPTKIPPRRHRSSVYGYFDWDQSDGKYHCKYCSACYKIDKKSGSTSGLLRHTRKHFAHLNERVEQEDIE